MAEWILFLSALLSSTLLPGGSEALLIWNVLEKPESWFQYLLLASLGNIIGSMITFGMGWLIAARFPANMFNKPSQLKAHHWIKRFGVWVLLFAWLPVIGDPLCLVAGWLRLSPGLSLLLISLGKMLRYSALVYVTLAGAAG